MVVVSLSMVSMLIFVAIWEYWGLCLKVAVPTLLAVLLLHIARPLKVAPLLNFRELWTMVRFGLPMDLSGFLATSVMTSTLLALVAWRWGVATLGLFAFAGLAESLMHQLSAAFSQVFIPRIAYRLGQHDDLRSCAHYAARPALAGLASLAGVGVVASLLCAPVIRVLVPAYAEAVPLMCITLWAGLYPVATLPGHVLIAAGRNHSMAGVYLSTFLVFALAAAVVLAAELPAMYMAAAYVAGKAGGAAAAWGLLWRQMACSPTGRAMVEAS
jgi:O-antigen/teichoic acid export membrane protein